MGDTLANLMEGFGNALTPINILWVFIGCILGTAVGVLPGLGSAMAVALLLPVTFNLDPAGAFIMFAGVYYGGLFGDSTTAILMNTPGNSTAIASTFEGYKMARSGRGSQALATAAIGAFIGGIIATVLVVFFSSSLVELASAFGPAEYFALAVFAFVATAAVVSDSAIKGLAALGIGLALAVVGVDPVSGTPRFTFGVPSFFDGIDVVVITVGLLALGEVLYVASRVHKDGPTTVLRSQGAAYLSRKEFREALPAWLRGTSFGVPFGIIPAGGAEIPTFMAYGLERKLDRKRRPPRFGTGAIRGLAAPEAAANATAGSAMGALLALGLPTSATAAIMLAAFQQYGMQPGPLLFSRNGELVWTLLASLFVGMIVLLIINLPFAPVWAKLLLIPKPYLYAGITVFAMLGVYASSSSVVDLFLLIGIGLVGFMMRRYGIPLAPVLIGVILGPLAETSLRQALAAGEGKVATLVDGAIPITLYSILLIAVVWIVLGKIRNKAGADI